MILNKESIPNSLKRVEVEVEEWGGSVYVQELTLKGREEFFNYITDEKNKASSSSSQAKLLSLSIVDEAGKTMFTTEELMEKSGTSLSLLYLVAQKISSLDVDSLKEATKKLKNLMSHTSSVN